MIVPTNRQPPKGNWQRIRHSASRRSTTSAYSRSKSCECLNGPPSRRTSLRLNGKALVTIFGVKLAPDKWQRSPQRARIMNRPLHGWKMLSQVNADGDFWLQNFFVRNALSDQPVESAQAAAGKRHGILAVAHFGCEADGVPHRAGAERRRGLQRVTHGG